MIALEIEGVSAQFKSKRWWMYIIAMVLLIGLGSEAAIYLKMKIRETSDRSATTFFGMDTIVKSLTLGALAYFRVHASLLFNPRSLTRDYFLTQVAAADGIVLCAPT